MSTDTKVRSVGSIRVQLNRYRPTIDVSSHFRREWFAVELAPREAKRLIRELTDAVAKLETAP